MNKPVIIEKLGLIYGRDAIFLDEIFFDESFNNTKLKGDFSGSLCKNIKNKEWIKYEIIFKNILEFRIIKSDYFNDEEYTSSFEEVLNSEKIKSKNQHHYIFHTYDDVIEIIATEFDIKINIK